MDPLTEAATSQGPTLESMAAPTQSTVSAQNFAAAAAAETADRRLELLENQLGRVALAVRTYDDLGNSNIDFMCHGTGTSR
jgi:hypothetical protein